MLNNVLFRCLFIKLCDNQLKSRIEHPYCQGKFLYLLFDSTHNLKNAYNNWINKTRFCYPDGFSDIFDNNGVADFKHIKALFYREESMPLKAAYMLTKQCLNPNSIARTSPRHALGK